MLRKPSKGQIEGMADFNRDIVIALLEEAATMLQIADPKTDIIAKERVELAAEKLGIIKNGVTFYGD